MRKIITITDELNDKIEEYSKAYGVSQSAFITFVVGQYINSVSTTYEKLNDVLSVDSVKDIVSSSVEHNSHKPCITRKK